MNLLQSAADSGSATFHARALTLAALALLGCSEPMPGTDAGDVDGGPPCVTAACDDGLFCNGIEACGANGVCQPAAVSPCAATGTCDEATDLCVCDGDGDGHDAISCGGDDCEDEDAGRFPGNPEICDAAHVDEDCNPATIGPDGDSDRYLLAGCCNTQPGGAMLCGDDCDDANINRAPGAPEICNGVDDDCDGGLDFPGEDDDDDGYADCVDLPDSVRDCDDAQSDVYPGAPEICDGTDSDCDGVDPLGEDRDGDRHAVPGAPCEGGYPQDDCEDDNAYAAPGSPERCNAGDDDCDLVVDEGCATGCEPATEAGWASAAWVIDNLRACCDAGACSPECAGERAAVGTACGSCVHEFATCALGEAAACADGSDDCAPDICDACARVVGDCSGLALSDCARCGGAEQAAVALEGLGAIALCQTASCEDADCVAACVRTELDLGAVCGGCVEAAFACQTAACAAACAPPTSRACRTCMDASCAAGLEACTGADVAVAACTSTEATRIAADREDVAGCLVSAISFEDLAACVSAAVDQPGPEPSSPFPTSECVSCLGDLQLCGRENCGLVCGSAGAACDACVLEQCEARFLSCAGFPTGA